MSIFKRAFLYVVRKRGKTILLFAILLIMATFVLTGLSIWKAAKHQAVFSCTPPYNLPRKILWPSRAFPA